ncbi:MAG: glycosyltransferase family 4 protein [Proteobacteria bacterium]|nr:glycosyltransferase family 4 protein [Pseudomonadota bacterium]
MDFIGQSGPSGIARIELALAKRLVQVPPLFGGAVDCSLGFQTRLSHAVLARRVEALEQCWHEDDRSGSTAAIESWLSGATSHLRRITMDGKPRFDRLKRLAALARAWPRHQLAQDIPRYSTYINASYANTDTPARLRWLKSRPDLFSVFFVYDVLPLEYPEFFWNGIETSFPKRLDAIFRHADLVVVNSRDVAEKVSRIAQTGGFSQLAIRTIHLPPPDDFLHSDEQGITGAGPYFVLCSTIEPRKNHALLLNLWRKMAGEMSQPPKLLVVGPRGWKNEGIVDLLERSPALKGHVLEVSNISTAALKRVLRGARALLMPSFGEGFGLPIVEALSVGTPVIASDIPVFREISQGCASLIDPLDAPAWEAAILRLAQDEAACAKARDQARAFAPMTIDGFFTALFSAIEETRPSPRSDLRGDHAY